MTQENSLTQIERKNISDAKMLDAAVELIVSKGPVLTQLKDVGEKAGYSRGLAGHRFGSKDGLFTFVTRSVGEKWLNQLTEETNGKTGYEAAAAALDAHQRLCEDMPKHVEAFYRLWFESLSPNSELKRTISGIHKRRYSDVVGWIEQGIEAGQLSEKLPTEDIAQHFCNVVIGIVYQWINIPGNITSMHSQHQELKRVMKVMMQLDD